jgi:hypothetical protein
MTSILPISVPCSVRVAACFTLAAASLVLAHRVNACETPPDLHIEVTAAFEPALVRSDYTVATIAALARQQHSDANRTLLGLYTSQFGYTIDVRAEAGQTCPVRIDTIVTLLLEHRLIEIGKEVAADTCLYPVALRHYRRLAEVDEQTVGRFSARTTAMLSRAASDLKRVQPSDTEDLNTAIRKEIRVVVDGTIAPLPAARRSAQQAVNNLDELTYLTHACSI